METGYYRTFNTVVEQKGFSQAAKVLNLTQPAVSFQIQSLERQYAVTLIDRSSYRFKLTEAGQLFYRLSKKLIDAEKRIEYDVASFKNSVTGEFTLGASSIPGEYLLPKLLGIFKKLYPDVRVSLEVKDTTEILESINRHHLDMGIVGGVPDKGSLEWEKFESDELLLLIPAGHPFEKKRITLSELVKYPFIIREEGSGTRKTFEEALRKKGVFLKDLNIAYELGSTKATISAVEEGLGLAVISKWAARELDKTSAIKSRALSFLDLKRDFFLVHNPRASLSAAQKEFIKFVQSRRSVVSG